MIFFSMWIEQSEPLKLLSTLSQNMAITDVPKNSQVADQRLTYAKLQTECDLVQLLCHRSKASSFEIHFLFLPLLWIGEELRKLLTSHEVKIPTSFC